VKLPNADVATIDESKIRDYLLSPTHPVGRYKARFFGSVGYRREHSERLVAALREVSRNDVSDMVETEFGTKYVVPGQLATPAGTTAAIVTVWMIRAGDKVPRLVTAYPGGSDED